MIGKVCNMKNIGEYSIEVQEILKRYDNERNKYRLKKNLSIVLVLVLLCFSFIMLSINLVYPFVSDRLMIIIIAFILCAMVGFLGLVLLFDIRLYNLERKIFGEVEQVNLKEYNYSTKKIEKEDFENTLLGKRTSSKLHYYSSNDGILHYKLDGCDCLIGTISTTNKRGEILSWTYIKKTLKISNEICFYSDLNRKEIITEKENLKDKKAILFCILKEYGEDVLVESDGQFMEILLDEVRIGHFEEICPEELSKEYMESNIKAIEDMINEIEYFIANI